MSEVVEYKVWIHIEGLDEDGDCVEGDSWHEPREAGCFASLQSAEGLRDMLLDAACPNFPEPNTKR